MPDPHPDAAVVVALHLFPGPGSRSVAQAVARAEALAERGLEGDRHSRRERHRRQVLLAEQEVLEHLGLEPGQIREQMTVRGLGLGELRQGTTLRIGGARFAVDGPCEPCERMDEIRDGLRNALDGRRGRFVKVIEGGPIAVGDRIVVEPA